jgi:hypothetical protein
VPTFRPDVILFAAPAFFAGMGDDVQVTEDFAYAAHEAANAGGRAGAENIALRALWLAVLHAAELPEYPEAVYVDMPNPGDHVPIPLLLSHTKAGQRILGVLSDVRPEHEN